MIVLNDVVYAGFLDRAGVGDLSKQVRAGLVLFHPEPYHIAAVPNKLFEDTSAGLPVIASDFPLWREVVDSSKCGLLVDPLEPQAIANGITYLMMNPGVAQDMGQKGRKAIQNLYNWQNEEKKLLTLYERLCDSPC